MQYFHSIDIVNRNIKCENMISDNYTVKLTDFKFLNLPRDLKD